MTIHEKNVVVGGAWVDKSKLKNGMTARIVTEVNSEPSKFTDEKTGEIKMQDVCKVRFDGLNDAVKVNINRITKNALIDAFGKDDTDWQHQPLTVDMHKKDGKTYMYLIPQGFRRTEDTEGYTIIVRDQEPEKKGHVEDIETVNEELAGQPEDRDLPF